MGQKCFKVGESSSSSYSSNSNTRAVNGRVVESSHNEVAQKTKSVMYASNDGGIQYRDFSDGVCHVTTDIKGTKVKNHFKIEESQCFASMDDCLSSLLVGSSSTSEIDF